MPVFVRQDGEWIDTAGSSEVSVGESSQWVTTSSGIHTTSNVGIGTTDPQYILDVNGDAKISDLKITGTQIIGNGTAGYNNLGDIELIPNESLLGQGQYLRIRPTAVTPSDQSHIHIESGNVNTADLVIGDDDRFVKIDHTGPVVIGVPDSTTTSTIIADSNSTTDFITIDAFIYPWARYLTVGDTVAVSAPGSEVINYNIVNTYISGTFGNLVEVTLDAAASYSIGDDLIFSYQPRSEWRFNPNSSATFPGNLGVGLGTGINSIINIPSPTEKLVVGGNVFIKDNGLTQYPQLYPYGGGVLYGSEIDIVTQTTDPVGIHSRFSIGEYRSVDYTIISNAEQVVKISTICTSSNNVYSEVYSEVNSGIATFAVDISGGNIRLVAIASTSSLMSHIVNYVATKIPNYVAISGLLAIFCTAAFTTIV